MTEEQLDAARNAAAKAAVDAALAVRAARAATPELLAACRSAKVALEIRQRNGEITGRESTTLRELTDAIAKATEGKP